MSDEIGFPAVPVPTSGVDGCVALATSMHAAPGVYAVLVGSGLSTGAGIPTGWQVVEDLVRRIATAEGVSPDEIGDSPEEWWCKEGRSDLRYDTLLAAVAPTDAARQTLLRGYFDPPPGMGGPIRPTDGHRALAGLCASGRVRLILTTNFDRLIERALEEEGVAPQVISSPAHVQGMIPLVHAPATVVKLHGDYAMFGLRNTPEELGTYPPKWNDLLDRIFDEFGLITIGWSAGWDAALREALKRCPSRRYPTFWTSHQGNLTEEARQLINLRRATVIDTTGGDEFLVDLAERIGRLDRVAARRSRPTAIRSVHYRPGTFVPQGWATLPLLLIRTVATLSPASEETCGIVRAEQREALVAALRSAPATTRLAFLAKLPAASAAAEPTAVGTTVPAAPSQWEPTSEYQSETHCSYRLGGDACSGISALVKVQFPPQLGVGNLIMVTFDVAASLEDPLRLSDAAELVRDGLLLVTSTVPEALADIVPADATVTHAEVHFFAPDQDGHSANRPNQMSKRLDMSALGPTAGRGGPHMDFAAHLSGPLVEREAAELTVEGIEYMAYAHGYLDPRLGLGTIRSELNTSFGS